jgi:preprotein translocase subunit SecG
MLVLLTIIHVAVCIFLIIVVLLQSGKAADLAGAFGGMGSQTAFGPRGSATLLSKATTISAVVFMVTSLSLSILATRNAGSVGKTVLDNAKQSAPATPAKTGQVPQAPGNTPAVPAPVPQSSAPAPAGAPSVSLGTETGTKTGQPIEVPTAPAQAPPAKKK